MYNIMEYQANLSKYAQPGGWNDPDMLEVGNGGMTHSQYELHFAMWCLLKAPLLIGADINNLDNFTLNLLGNDRLIAVN